mmetsp:Transcript_17135/g.33668  ORF Transcript_17135/g.33668 Transcript_17135/m.33668 type:complete len:186 (+) Transcript_17135:405-962(+)
MTAASRWCSTPSAERTRLALSTSREEMWSLSQSKVYKEALWEGLSYESALYRVGVILKKEWGGCGIPEVQDTTEREFVRQLHSERGFRVAHYPGTGWNLGPVRVSLETDKKTSTHTFSLLKRLLFSHPSIHNNGTSTHTFSLLKGLLFSHPSILSPVHYRTNNMASAHVVRVRPTQVMKDLQQIV